MNEQYDYIELKKVELSAKTVELAKSIIKETDGYLSKFNIAASFSFSAPNVEKIENDYMTFLLKISKNISLMTDLNAELASLIIAADKAAQIEPTLLLQTRFDAFCNFEKALYEFTSKTDDAISSGKISNSFIISSTQKFKLALETLIKSNT